MHRIGIQDADDMYNGIGYGGISMSKLVSKLKEEFDKVVKTDVQENISEPEKITTSHRRRKNTGGVIVDGVDGCSVKFAKCCNPLPGDSIIGFITKGFGVSIHKTDCPNVKIGMAKQEELDRWISAKWDNPAASVKTEFEAALQITAVSSVRLLADITNILADMRVPLISITTRNKNDFVIINIIVSCKDVDHLKSIISRLNNIPNVDSITRSYI